MSYQVNMCCLCLSSSTDKLHHLNDIGDPSDVSYYEKINLSLPTLDFKNEYAESYVLCLECCSTIDNMYEFNNRSIRNMEIMTRYLTQLSSPNNQRCRLVEFIKLELGTLTSKVTDGTVPVSETREDNSNLIIHQPDDAYVSTLEMVNDVGIKEELDIKIEEPDVVADSFKHAYEFRSDFNSTHTCNRGCSKLEDATTGVTDVMVHDNVPVSDSLQANDGKVLHQAKDAYIETGELINDVQIEENFIKVEAVYIESEEYTDDEPGSSADPFNAASDASQYRGEQNSSIGDSAGTSSDLTALRPTGTKNIVHACDTCDKKFPRKSSLQRHRQIHTGEKPYTCEVCYKGFIQNSDLVKHKRRHTGDKPNVCEVCNKGFIWNSDLVIHKREHTGEKPYECEVCKKGFAGKNKLAIHKRMHTGEKPYVCEVCNKRFNQQSYLAIHKRKCGEEQYVCDICDKRFTQNDAFVRHQRFHTGEKPYLCEVCNKGFTRNFALAIHKRKHTGEKPYVCNEGFVQGTDHAKPKRIHAGKKTYVCEVCDKGFLRNSDLVTHQRTHNRDKPYVCEVCKKRFTKKGYLVIHTRIHTGETPYVCEVCTKGFSRNEHLIQHKRIHTGEKPFVCEVCNKGFSQKGNLIKHQRRQCNKEFTGNNK